jgi:hypothetical protein
MAKSDYSEMGTTGYGLKTGNPALSCLVASGFLQDFEGAKSGAMQND